MTLAKHAKLAKEEKGRMRNQPWRTTKQVLMSHAHLSCRERSQAPRQVRGL
jgi:hypothetical protein